MNLEANIMLSTGISSSRVLFRCVRFMGCTSEKLWFWATVCHHVGAPKLPHPRLPLASLIGKGIDWCPGPASNGKVDARGLFDFDFEMWLNNTVFAVLFVIFRGNFLRGTGCHSSTWMVLIVPQLPVTPIWRAPWTTSNQHVATEGIMCS